MVGIPVQKWWSVFKGLVLGSLLTTCMILLYCLSAPEVQHVLHELPVPYSCSHGPSNTSSHHAPGRRRCTPKVDVMFLKTHKTASSTFLNILFRFGEKHRLKFAFPDSRNDFFYPAPFQRSQVKDYRPGMCFNIICNHMRFHAAEVARVLPADASYITILRDPALLAESSFHYFRRLVPLTWKISGQDKLAEFLEHPQLYYHPEGFHSFYLRNLLFFDLGGDNNLHPDDPEVERAILGLARRFQLVMLVEHFEESLILLKEALCWDMEDLVFFKLNARKDSTVSRLSPQLRAKALQWNALDWKLYRHFNHTFWSKVDAYGRERMARDVSELRRRNAEMASLCIQEGHAVEAASILDTSMQPWQPIGEKSIMGYNLKKGLGTVDRGLCQKMLTPELQYLSQMGVSLWRTRLWAHVRDLLQL